MHSLADLGYMNWGKARRACDDLVVEGHDDWYLPNRKELKEIYQNLQSTGRLHLVTNSVYWASEDLLGALAWTVSFWNGVDRNWAKNMKYYVRAVRKF